MRKAAAKEIEILQKVQKLCEEKRCKRFVRFYDHFDHQNFLCMGFELMWKNLRGAMKEKTGGRGGFDMAMVHSCARQILEGLDILDELNIVHTDCKPDNILIDSDYAAVKICDLGSAMDVEDSFVTPYLGPRYYRAPEVMLGCKLKKNLENISGT